MLRRWLNRLLVADLLLVLGGFIWFVLAIVATYVGVPAVYRWWVQLWFPLFQPALGILMAGAVISGLWGWWSKRSDARL
ncbi:MAG: hypothetical protein Q6K70_06240 [Thermostichales cyanobacterium DRC_bins_46]